jgi:OPA family glycerol-3-phosphate transporter-like MFS transporter
MSLERKNQTKLKRWQWRILLAFAFLYFFYYFGRENIGFIIPLLKEEYGWSNAQLGIVTSGLFWAYALGQLFWGRLSDRIGGRLLCGLGGLLSMILNWVCSFASSVTTLAIPWTINGLAQSMGWAPGNKLIANWWPREKRGYAIGIILSFSAGAIIVIWFFSGWIGTHWGWKGLFRIPVVLLGGMSLAYFFLVREHPHEVGFLDYKEESLDTRNKENVYKNRGIGPYLNLLSNYKFDLACLSAGIANFARYAFTIWIPLYYSEVGGFPLEKVALICLAFPVGMSIGPPVAGWISDKFFKAKRYPVIVIFLSISAISTLTLGFVPTTKLIGNEILLFLVGFSIYGLQGPVYALSTELAGKNQTGTAVGIMDSASYMFGALQGIIIGIILTSSGGNWRLVFILVGIIQLIGVEIARRIEI